MTTTSPLTAELGLALLRLGSLRVALADFTEHLHDTDALWDELTPMTRSRALQLHDLTNLIGDDLDQIRARLTHPAGKRRPVHNHGTEDGPGLSCHESRLPDGSLVGRCLLPELDQ